MQVASTTLSRRVADAMLTVFGDSPLTLSVQQVCDRYDRDLTNIQAGRGIHALLIAIVGAKSQGKTWAARQFVRDETVRQLLHSGDLSDDATTRLVWVGPVAPESLEPESEMFFQCQSSSMVHIGQPYVILDTPGLTDSDARAAKLANEALSLAPLKLLVIARDQIRAAANMSIAHQIDGAVCIPVISSVEPDEMPGQGREMGLAEDLLALRGQLAAMSPRSRITKDVLVPDFEITGDEQAASDVFLGGVLDRINEVGLANIGLSSSRELRMQSAGDRLRSDVSRLIGDELPQLADAVNQLNRETRQLPSRVLESLLGSETVLETGVRMRLRARLATDTSLLWFPYRTVLSTLNLTQGAWDRVMLAITGSVPSLFGALTSWAHNLRQSREFESQIQDGIRSRTQQQVEERMQPLCDQFHRTIMKLRPREDRSKAAMESQGLRLMGIDEFQSRSQQIFDEALEQSATPNWLVQLYAVFGTLIFWALMAAPVIVVYRQYFETSFNVFSGREAELESFPHPTPGLFFTSLLLSLLPLCIYCMLVLTWTLSRRKLKAIAARIVGQHQQSIEELRDSQVIRLHFEDELLQQAEYLLNLSTVRFPQH